MTIAGAFHFVGDMPDIARSLRAMALGPGKARLHRETDILLGACDDGEIAVEGPVVALFHGRLDQADGLQGRSAAAIAIQAYRRWGADFPAQLIGDFACAIWDGATRRLLLARDPFGAEPLHFWRDGRSILFATEPQGLLALPEVAREIDQRWVARWLALLPQDEPGTAYRGIDRVLPGHVAILDEVGVRQVRTWKPEELPPVRLARDADYAEAARALLDEAIRCRIAGVDTVGSQLSAGLDSSSVTALAARQLAERGLRLTSFTAVPVAGFDGGSDRDHLWNEGPLAARLVQACPNIDHVLVPNRTGPLFDTFDRVSGTAGMPPLVPVNQAWVEAIGHAAKQRGVTVMLSAGKGNMSISYDGFGSLTDLARRGRWIALGRHMAALHRAGHGWRTLAGRVILPALPRRLRQRTRRLIGRPEERLRDFSALRTSFADDLGVLDEAERVAGNVGHDATSRAARMAVLGRVDPGMLFRAERRRFGFVQRDPMADRRLVEFCLAIPPEQYLLHGESRSLVRRAMAGILPDQIRLERRRGLQGADWALTLNAERAQIAAELDRLERSPLASASLDLPRLRGLLDSWPETGWHSLHVMRSYRLALMRGVATGRFLRQFEGGND